MLKRVVAAGLTVAAICCTHSSVGPSATRALRSVFILGPDSVAPGTTAQFRLYGIFSDGGQQDVTANASWTSTNPEVLRSVGAGQFAAVQDGDAGVTGEQPGLTARKVVTAIEPGTYVLKGVVSDGGFGLPGARVDVVSGVGAGKSATTDANGSYRLFGIAGPVDVKASLDGYQPTTQSTTVGGQLSLNFSLSPLIAPPDVSGDWQLTLTASPSCSTLPAIATTRTYTATIAEAGSRLTVTLGGAEFARDPYFGPEARMNRFSGRIFDRSVVFKLNTFSYYGTHYDLEEVLADKTLMAVYGDASGTFEGSTISATFDGAISLFGTTPGYCSAHDHRMSFARRSTTARR